VIILIFVRYMEKRDALLRFLTSEIKQPAEATTAHTTGDPRRHRRDAPSRR
jgi:hypothetical protein